MPLFAVAAAVVFFLMLLNIQLGSINMVALGLFFVACHLAFGGVVTNVYRSYRG